MISVVFIVFQGRLKKGEVVKDDSIIETADKVSPKIVITEPDISRGIRINGRDRVAVAGQITDPSGIDWARINDNLIRLDSEGKFREEVATNPGQNHINVEASDKVGNVSVVSIEVVAPEGTVSSANSADRATQMQLSSIKPTIWALGIGVSRYRNPSINLRFAANDAQVLLQEITIRTRDLYSEVFTKVLVDEEATRENIILAMHQFLGQASKGDVVFIFIAGHGVQHRATGSYYFLTHDADDQNMITQALKWSDFEFSTQPVTTSSSLRLWVYFR